MEQIEIDGENIQLKFQFPKTIWKHIDTNFHVLNDYNISVKFQKKSIYSCAVNLQYLKVYRYPKTNSLPRSTQLDCICITALWLVRRSMTLVSFERVSLANIHVHAIFEVSFSYGSKFIAEVKVFRYVGQRSLSRSLGQSPWQDQKGIITKIVHLKYQISASNGSKKVFRNVSQRS